MDLRLLIFVSLLTYFLGLGYSFWKNKNIKLFIASAVLLPFTSSLAITHTRFQINVYYAFLIFPLLFFVLRALLRFKIKKSTFISCSLLGVFILLFLFLRIPSGFKGISSINILKDLKPIIFLMVGFVFIDIIAEYRISWNSRMTYKLLRLNFYVTFLFFIVLSNSSLISIITDDPFYKLDGVRYLTMGTFFAIFYFIAKLALKEKLSLYELIYIITPVFLSGNRTFFIVIGLTYILNMVLSIRDIKSFIKKIALFFAGLFVLFIGVLNFNAKLKERILTMFDLELVAEQLVRFRFAPFFNKLEKYELHDYIIGRGIGETFFIPWFTWRENVDDYNIYMDNIYLTLYLKYGVLSFFIFFMLYYYIQKSSKNKRFRTLVTTYFVLMGATTAYMYQISFLFILLMLVIFETSKTHTQVKDFL